MHKVYVIGTMDTKAEELRFAADCVRRAGAGAVLVDVGTKGGDFGADVSAVTIAGQAALGLTDRGVAVAGMARALTAWLVAQPDIGAVLGLG